MKTVIGVFRGGDGEIDPTRFVASDKGCPEQRPFRGLITVETDKSLLRRIFRQQGDTGGPRSPLFNSMFNPNQPNITNIYFRRCMGLRRIGTYRNLLIIATFRQLGTVNSMLWSIPINPRP